SSCTTDWQLLQSTNVGELGLLSFLWRRKACAGWKLYGTRASFFPLGNAIWMSTRPPLSQSRRKSDVFERGTLKLSVAVASERNSRLPLRNVKLPEHSPSLCPSL